MVLVLTKEMVEQWVQVLGQEEVEKDVLWLGKVHRNAVVLLEQLLDLNPFKLVFREEARMAYPQDLDVPFLSLPENGLSDEAVSQSECVAPIFCFGDLVRQPESHYYQSVLFSKLDIAVHDSFVELIVGVVFFFSYDH